MGRVRLYAMCCRQLLRKIRGTDGAGLEYGVQRFRIDVFDRKFQVKRTRCAAVSIRPKIGFGAVES